MCSAAWNFREGGYELAFNRDESWTRPLSSDPSLENDHPVPGACARDTAAGGTWLFTNQAGITLAVMNAYPGDRNPMPGKCSRGHLPLLAGLYQDPSRPDNSLADVTWENYAPCELLLIAPEGVRHFGWDGANFRTHLPPARNFLTTSSIRTTHVRNARQSRFDAISGLAVGEILDDTLAADPAEAICATREDGGTVSRTSVVVGPETIRFTVTRRGETARQVIFPRKS
ncbi:MAG: NRDE family protein [Luteolibacter sp.]